MEQGTFDRLSRSLASGLSRRRLAVLASLGVGSLTSRSGDVDAKKHKKKKKKKTVTCAAPTVACGTQCVALDTTSNCGRCGVQCSGGQTCQAGVCQNATNCGVGETACGSFCCTGEQFCQGGLFCVTCGGPAEPCCAGQTCEAGLACIFQGTVCGPPL